MNIYPKYLINEKQPETKLLPKYCIFVTIVTAEYLKMYTIKWDIVK